jgi:type IV secretion system protein VirB8
MTAAMSSGTLSDYFAEARRWDEDRLAHARRQTRLGWLVAAGAGACAIASTLAVIIMMPLKQTDPFLIRVDSSTGIVDVVPVYAGSSSLDESVTRYFLGHYVSVCERFDFSTAQSDYEECGAFHDARRNQTWYAQWNRSNPQSPLNVHRDGSTVAARVSSISFLHSANGAAQSAQVRYLKADRASAESPEVITHWIATVQYAYAPPSRDAKVRQDNPLGFKVLAFTTEPEISAGAGAAIHSSNATGVP